MKETFDFLSESGVMPEIPFVPGSGNLFGDKPPRFSMLQLEIDVFVSQYGEKYRKLFTSALTWLSQNESSWGLDEPMDRKVFIAGLVEKTIIR